MTTPKYTADGQHWHFSLSAHGGAVAAIGCLNTILLGNSDVQPVMDKLNRDVQASYTRLEAAITAELHRLNAIIDDKHKTFGRIEDAYVIEIARLQAELDARVER